MPLEIRLLKELEYRAVNDFYNTTTNIDRAAPKTARTYNEFCWEFIHCTKGKAIYAGAWEIEKEKEPVLVGVICVIILKMLDEGGSQILTAKGEAALIDFKAFLKHKKTDILKELFAVLIAECRSQGVEFLWGFNNIPATYKRLGFENPFKSFYGIIVLKPFKAYKNIALLKETNTVWGKLKIIALTGLARLFSLKKMFIVSRKNKYTINFELDENKTLFANASRTDKLVFLVQDKDFFNRRILENPHPINYKSYQLFDNTTLVAQVICSVKDDVAFIEQTLFDKKLSKKNIYYLLKYVLQSLQNENVCLVRYMGFKNNPLNLKEMNCLKSLGLILTGKGEWFTFKNLSDESLIKPENIYFSRMYKQGVN
ncbi:MAG TPA: hypothetical protein VK835_02995 [Bacteroidia bacterium]|nr:hypothetical protein [Bacteroidia bacterium]